MKIEDITVGEVRYRIRSLLDLQQFSDPENCAAKLGISSALWPLFGRVWPMSFVLAKIMLTEPVYQRRVLEVGCGLALPSIVVQKQGGDITASDYHPLAKAFLTENTKLNLLPQIRFETGNWNLGNTSAEKYDLLIGSDLLYQEASIELLSSFADSNLSADGSFILVDPGRGAHRKFARSMQRRGFNHSWSDLELFSDNGKRPSGFIFRFSR